MAERRKGGGDAGSGLLPEFVGGEKCMWISQRPDVELGGGELMLLNCGVGEDS